MLVNVNSILYIATLGILYAFGVKVVCFFKGIM
jgi:hypothetical protein